MRRNLADLVFRLLFSLIFIGLGAEHAFADSLIQKLMPAWVPSPRIVSALCGLWLLVGGILIAIGYRLRTAALMLGVFLILVTATVHAPALMGAGQPSDSPESQWLWDTLQRSNFVKNLCLLGVCIMLTYYRVGDWSLERLIARRRAKSTERKRLQH